MEHAIPTCHQHEIVIKLKVFNFGVGVACVLQLCDPHTGQRCTPSLRHLSSSTALMMCFLFPNAPSSPSCLPWAWMFGNYRTLFGNKIKSVAKRAFSGLEGLEHL